jgi:hypothetical protein
MGICGFGETFGGRNGAERDRLFEVLAGFFSPRRAALAVGRLCP